MRAKLRALVVVGLSAGVFVPPLMAEPKPSVLESIGLPSMFSRSDEATATPRIPSRTAGGFIKPGNSARAESKPPKAASSGTTSGGLFPSFKGFDQIFGTNGTTSGAAVGQPADGIEAPPPPTLEASEPQGPAASSTPVVKKTTQTAATSAAKPVATKTPSKDISPAIPKTAPAKTDPMPIVKTTAPVSLAATTKKTPARTSSRRGWQGTEPNYTALHDGHAADPVTTESDIAPAELIDRRPLLDEATSAEIEPADDANQSSLPPPSVNLAENPPIPIISGQEPLEGRDRLSTAARLGGAAVRMNGEGDTQQQPAVAPVQAASYNLPPILSPEEARKLRANRGK